MTARNVSPVRSVGSCRPMKRARHADAARAPEHARGTCQPSPVASNTASIVPAAVRAPIYILQVWSDVQRSAKDEPTSPDTNSQGLSRAFGQRLRSLDELHKTVQQRVTPCKSEARACRGCGRLIWCLIDNFRRGKTKLETSITTGAGRALHTRPEHIDIHYTPALHRHVEYEPSDDADDDAADAALDAVLHQEHHGVKELEGEPEPVEEARSDRHLEKGVLVGRVASVARRLDDRLGDGADLERDADARLHPLEVG
eukprot:scaffold56104_cov60-Phaeocystis_antarctica.AAC.2